MLPLLFGVSLGTDASSLVSASALLPASTFSFDVSSFPVSLKYLEHPDMMKHGAIYKRQARYIRAAISCLWSIFFEVFYFRKDCCKVRQ